MINSNMTIMFTIRVAMDTFNLAQGWQKSVIPATTLERLARGDKSTRFQMRAQQERFQGDEPTKFL
jgi:hypothetical protein